MALREHVSISCVAQCSLDYNVPACKSDNRVIYRVSNERREAIIMKKYLRLNTGLTQGYGISSAHATGI